MERIKTWLLMAMCLLITVSAQSVCNSNGNCEWPETCNTCSDCHSCDINSYTGQRAKYIDKTCANNGNGLADSCATSVGGAGRFNELQSAIDSLVAGDTLYIHPGDYYHAKQDYGNYEVRSRSSGTAARPTIITARFRDNPPVLHSTNPAGGSASSSPAITTHWDDPASFLIIDGIKVRGLAEITGQRSILQNIECTYGGGACDGNWACLRIEWCTDCIAHHNFVHDVNDAGFCSAGTSRPCGLKEFSSTRAIWEFNTVRNSLQWGYDLHRSSTDPTIRYNKFENSGTEVGIRFGRSGDNSIYGNIIIGTGACITGLELNDLALHNDLIGHNTCVFPGLGINIDSQYPTTIKDNIIHAAGSQRIEQGNTNVGGAGHIVDWNAYDSNAYYHSGLYASRDYDSLTSWQQATGHDMHSHEAEGGYCQFVDAPSSSMDFTYDLHVTGACLSASSTGGQLGAYGLVDCVGHSCGVNSIPQPGCGDGICGSGENCGNCPSDCRTPSSQVCCSGTLYTGNCCTSTQCASGQTCTNHACQTTVPSCGDGTCGSGETCTSCPSDCLTPSGQVCCSGILYTGNCCASTQCTSGQTCTNYVCQSSGTSGSPCASPPTGVFFCEDFEDNTANSFTSQYYGNLQGNSQFAITNANAATGQYSVRRQYTQGSTSDAFVTQHFGDATKTPIWSAGQGQHYQDIYVQYKVYYSPGFDFSADNNKQIIFGTDDGQRHEEACCNPWVAHYTTIASCTGYFCAERNSKQANDNSIWYGLGPNIGYSSSNRFNIQTGRWYTVQARKKLNDAGQSNGVFEMWVDGTKVADYQNILYRVPDTGTFGTDFNYGTNFVMLSTYITNAAPATQAVYFDDVMIGTQFISSAAQCTAVHRSDNSPCDGTISITELSAFLSTWRGGGASMPELMEAIRIWKG